MESVADFLAPRALLAILAIACGIAAGALAGCAPPDAPPERDCSFTAWARAKKSVPRLTASFDDWQSPGAEMSEYGDGWYTFTDTLPEGEHGYLITDDKGTHPDPYNPQRTYRGETEVSLARGYNCGSPEATIDSVETTPDGSVTIKGTFLAVPEGDSAEKPLARVRGVTREGLSIEADELSSETGTFVLHASGLPRGKYTFTIEAEDAAGRLAVSPAAVAWVNPASPSWEEGILYQVVVDRFRGDGGLALDPPATPGLRAGGSLAGVTAAIESGYFDEMGVSALWLSPVYDNPEGLFEGRDGEMYEAFHGYWVLGSREVEPAIGGKEELTALIAAAHAHGLAVLFDFVPNHLFEENPRYLEHAADGWFNDGPDTCVCGIDPGCDWGHHIQHCWFAPYLPDVRWQAEGSMRETLQDLRFWMRELDADGVRIDATPMMPRLATRRMAEVLRREFGPTRGMFSIGEVFTGPGETGTDAIKYFLGPDGLDGAFDFPLTWAIRGALATENGGFDGVEASLEYTESAMAGSGSVLGRMVDNHDMGRFLSEASGHGGADAWFNPAPVPQDARPYEKLQAALALVMTLPGLPVVYYGTEVGLAGGSDPDNRRVLPSEGALSASQQAVLATTRRLGKLRACSNALKIGSRKAFLAAPRRYGFVRVADEGAAVVMFSTEPATAQIVPPLEAVPPGPYVDVFSAERFTVGDGTPVPVEPFTFRILLPENDPCLESSPPSP
ncbi:MAG: alpha-amylase family glycosyl hydrolase [Polyangiaceae bacterium]